MTSQMINNENNGNVVGIGGTGIPLHEKQLLEPLKKTALRDVQNENKGSLIPGGGRSSGDAIKVCGTKRLTPERPLSSQDISSLSANENVMNARRRFELELGRGRNNVEKYSYSSVMKNMGRPQQEESQKPNQMRDSNFRPNPLATLNNMAPPIMTSSSNGPSVPSSFGKYNNGTQTAKMLSELPRAVDHKSTKDHLRAERYLRLQKFLKQCDEANQREYIQMLLHLSPAELSKHAVELENRSIQLTLVEGNEMQRKQLLNILPKPSPMNNMLPPPQLQANKFQ